MNDTHNHQRQQKRKHDTANHVWRRNQRRKLMFFCGSQYDAGKLGQHYFSPWVRGRAVVSPQPVRLFLEFLLMVRAIGAHWHTGAQQSPWQMGPSSEVHQSQTCRRLQLGSSCGLAADLAFALHNPLRGGQFRQPHGPAGVQLLG